MRRMSDRHLPSRVLLSRDNSLHSAKTDSGLSSVGRKGRNDVWCFCGAASDDGLLQMQDVSMTHCHLFQQLTASGIGTCCDIQQNHYRNVGLDDRSNGKTRRGLRLLLDGSKPYDSVKLATVTCSYGIPSNVECLDLAVDCLQRMSGHYFINRKLPCVVSTCSCHISNKSAVNKAQDEQATESARQSSYIDSRKKHSGKPRECDLPTLHELDRLYSATHPLTDNSSSSNNLPTQHLQQWQSYRCTRSASKQRIDVLGTDASDPTPVVQSRSAAADVAGPTRANREVSTMSPHEYSLESDARSDTGLTPVIMCRSNSRLTSDNSTLSRDFDSLQVTAAGSTERKARSTAAAGLSADSQSCDADSVKELSLKTVTTDTRGSLTKYRQQQRRQKFIVSRKQTRRRALRSSGTTRELRSHMLLSSSSLLALADDSKCKKRRPSTDNSSCHVKRRHRGSSKLTQNNAGITAKCEVLVPRLAVNGSCSKPTRKVGWKQKQQLHAVNVGAVRTVSVNDAAVRLKHADDREMTCNLSSVAESTIDSVIKSSAAESQVITHTTKPQNMNNVASEHQTSCDVSKLCALSVDTSFDYDDICNSPASPLPVDLKMTDNVVQLAALLLRKRSVVSSHSTATNDDNVN